MLIEFHNALLADCKHSSLYELTCSMCILHCRCHDCCAICAMVACQLDVIYEKCMNPACTFGCAFLSHTCRHTDHQRRVRTHRQCGERGCAAYEGKTELALSVPCTACTACTGSVQGIYTFEHVQICRICRAACFHVHVLQTRTQICWNIKSSQLD